MDWRTKQWIDNASYEELLQKWRFAECGDPLFYGEVGEYYQKVMFEKRDKISNEERVAASKSVGWEKP
jgi:hypothetical protein